MKIGSKLNQHKQTLIIILVFVLLTIFFAIQLLPSAKSQFTQTSQFSPADLEAGLKIYNQNCASCHGANLEGEANWRVKKQSGVFPAPPHDETGHTWHHSDIYLFNYTKYGGQKMADEMQLDGFMSGMPGFEGALSDEEIWQVLRYIQSTWSERVRTVQSQIP